MEYDEDGVEVGILQVGEAHERRVCKEPDEGENKGSDDKASADGGKVVDDTVAAGAGSSHVANHDGVQDHGDL